MWGNPKRRKNRTGKTGSVYIKYKGSLRSAASQVLYMHKVWPVIGKVINPYLFTCACASHSTWKHTHTHICLLVCGKWGEGGACAVASASGDCSTCEEVALAALGALGHRAVAMKLNIGERGHMFSSAHLESAWLYQIVTWKDASYREKVHNAFWWAHYNYPHPPLKLKETALEIPQFCYLECCLYPKNEQQQKWGKRKD